MPRAATLLSTFNAGEWSPDLFGRVDLDKYRNACRTVENFILLAQGPAVRRPGTRFVAPTRENGPVRLIPFEFSTEQAYVIEAGDHYFRFFKDRGQIQSAPGVPVELGSPYAAADLAGLKWAQSADVLYLCHPAHPPRKLSRSSHTAWSIVPLDFLDGPYLDENATPVTLAPATASGSGVALTASAALFAASDLGRLVRIKHSSTWGWAKIVGFTSPTLVQIDIKANFGGVGAVTTWRLGAWSATTGWPSCVIFYEERLFFAGTRLQPQTLWGSASGAYESFAPTGSDGTVKDDNALDFTISDDRVNAVRWLSAGKTLAIGTVGGEFNAAASNLNEAITPTNITVRRETTIGSADSQAIRVGRAVLYIQRARRKLYEMAYSFEADAFTAPEMSLLARHLARDGLIDIAYQQEPWSIVWAIGGDGGLLGLTYLRDQDVVGWHRHSISGVEARVLAMTTIAGTRQDELWLVVERRIGGVLRRYVEFLDYAFEPAHPADKADAFFLDAGLTFDGAGTSALRVTGAAQTAGAMATLTADDAAFGPGDAGREVHVRFRDPETGQYRTGKARLLTVADPQTASARITVPFPATKVIAARAWALAATVISGLEHLEGETVAVLADGATHPDCTVVEGRVVLARPAAKVQVGLGYRSRLTTMDIDAGAADGTAQGKPKRVHRVVARFLDSLGCRVGWRGGQMEDVIFRDGTMPMDQSPDLFTGDKVVSFPKGWDRQASITVEQDQPLPCTIVALIAQLTTMDG